MYLLIEDITLLKTSLFIAGLLIFHVINISSVLLYSLDVKAYVRLKIYNIRATPISPPDKCAAKYFVFMMFPFINLELEEQRWMMPTLTSVLLLWIINHLLSVTQRIKEFLPVIVNLWLGKQEVKFRLHMTQT